MTPGPEKSAGHLEALWNAYYQHELVPRNLDARKIEAAKAHFQSGALALFAVLANPDFTVEQRREMYLQLRREAHNIALDQISAAARRRMK